MAIQPILAFKDNYIWAIIQQDTAIIIDPGDAQPVIHFLNQHKLSLTAILITHHHWDHTNGMTELKNLFHVPVFAPANEKIAGVTNPVTEKDAILISILHFKIFDIPGHTLGHSAYFFQNALFCGDTLFAAGCGKLFEGTASQMYHSLLKLAALPDDTKIYCGHEYTLSNLYFAETVEPDNKAIQERIKRVKILRDQDLPSLPSTMAEEKATNPFLRCMEKSVIQAAEKYVGRVVNDPVEVFAIIREWKNSW